MMKTKLYLFVCFTVFSIGLHSQVSVFEGTNIGINPARITESKTTAGDFQIQYTGISSQGLLIYESANFEVNDLLKAWDGTFRGKPAHQGVYVYVIEMQFRSGRRELFKGNLHLLR